MLVEVTVEGSPGREPPRAPLTAFAECGWRSVMAGMSRFLPEKKEMSCRKTRRAFVQTAPAPETARPLSLVAGFSLSPCHRAHN